jgi:hypothetical protein
MPSEGWWHRPARPPDARWDEAGIGARLRTMLAALEQMEDLMRAFPSRPETNSANDSRASARTDRVVLITFRNGAERSRVTGHLALERRLRGTPLDGEAVERIGSELREGHAVVLAELPEVQSSDVQARLEGLARVA